ncbi:hypothetical protein F3J37_21455 [Pantoea sp. Al-1710]|uniref:Uncharacterized protein n=1 Tax=Candidatus Pantoea communis TaxID=2608354 RepID=A0ABX0RUH9_9GAMM|nr:hypothetical protein [Pantoea communis]NIG21247.1 hypothetical protein [Pantoea communis]
MNGKTHFTCLRSCISHLSRGYNPGQRTVFSEERDEVDGAEVSECKAIHISPAHPMPKAVDRLLHTMQLVASRRLVIL